MKVSPRVGYHYFGGLGKQFGVWDLPLRSPFANRLQYLPDRFIARLRPNVSFAVQTHAHRVGLHIPAANHEHGMDFCQLSLLDFAVDLVRSIITFGPDHLSAQMVRDRKSTRLNSS